jgi:AcrR family transcriptional regulator
MLNYEMTPRPYQMAQRQAAGDKTRERILVSARQLLLAEDFARFTMEAVSRKADVSRLTVYYQFESKAGLLEALYNHIAKSGDMERLAGVFGKGGDPLRTLREFIEVFARFWASDRDVIRRLHALAAIDSDIGKGIRDRNERRRNGLRVIVERYCRVYPPLTSRQEPVAIDTVHMLTSFETFDALARNERSVAEVVEIIQTQAYKAIGFTPKFVSRPL